MVRRDGEVRKRVVAVRRTEMIQRSEIGVMKWWWRWG